MNALQEIELVGGPMDGQRVAWPTDNPIVVIAVPDTDLGRVFDSLVDQAVTIPYAELAYQRDCALTWRYVYAGRRQKR